MYNVVYFPDSDYLKEREFECVYPRFNEVIFSTLDYLFETIRNIPVPNGQTSIYNPDFRIIISNAIKFILNAIYDKDREKFIIEVPYMAVGTVRAITQDHRTILSIIMRYLYVNILNCGIFTEYWIPIGLPEVLTSLGPADRLIMVFHRETSNEGLEINDSDYQKLLDESFEENRQEVLNRKFSEKEENVSIEPEITGMLLEPGICELCCEESEYACADCLYNICEKCLTKIIHSTNTCPCCQKNSFKLKKYTSNE